MKRLSRRSQYFLRKPHFVAELIGHTNIKKSDTVYDIGAGSGIIASVLAARVARVIAYENDARMAAKLRDNLGTRQNIEIIEGDFLKAQLPTTPYKVFANIPFHLSSPILKKLTESDDRPTAIYLIVQKQFANKLLIDDARFTGLLGAQIAPLYVARIRKRLQRTDFWPHPAVDTVLVELLLRDTPLVAHDRLTAYRKFIADCYNDPKIFIKTPRSHAGISSELKPSQLTADQWVSLFEKQDIY